MWQPMPDSWPSLPMRPGCGFPCCKIEHDGVRRSTKSTRQSYMTLMLLYINQSIDKWHIYLYCTSSSLTPSSGRWRRRNAVKPHGEPSWCRSDQFSSRCGWRHGIPWQLISYLQLLQNLTITTTTWFILTSKHAYSFCGLIYKVAFLQPTETFDHCRTCSCQGIWCQSWCPVARPRGSDAAVAASCCLRRQVATTADLLSTLSVGAPLARGAPDVGIETEDVDGVSSYN